MRVGPLYHLRATGTNDVGCMRHEVARFCFDWAQGIPFDCTQGVLRYAAAQLIRMLGAPLAREVADRMGSSALPLPWDPHLGDGHA